MKKLRTVVIGYGFMGKTHAANIFSGSCMELVAIVDKNLNTKIEGNFDTSTIDEANLSKIKIYTSFDDCLAQESLDAAVVCVHTAAHFALVHKAIEHQLHVFVEKPFVLNPSEGATLIAEAERAGTTLAVGHVVRFMPAYRELKRICDSGLYGELRFISLSRFTGVPDWGDWKIRRKEFGSSGGALFDLVIHDIDYLRYLLGTPDQTECTYFGGELSPHDYICSFWKYNHKKINVKVEGGDVFHAKFPFEAGFKASFERASVVWTSASGRELIVADEEKTEIIKLDDAGIAYRAEIEYFAQCAANRIYPTECSAESALETVKLCARLVGETDSED